MDSKKPWTSKTILFNAVMSLVGVAAVFLPEANAVAVWMNGNVGTIAAVWSVLNILLRFVTKDKIVLVD